MGKKMREREREKMSFPPYTFIHGDDNRRESGVWMGRKLRRKKDEDGL